MMSTLPRFFELDDQVNTTVTDDLVRDADSVVRRRIKSVFGTRTRRS